MSWCLLTWASCSLILSKLGTRIYDELQVWQSDVFIYTTLMLSVSISLQTLGFTKDRSLGPNSQSNSSHCRTDPGSVSWEWACPATTSLLISFTNWTTDGRTDSCWSSCFICILTNLQLHVLIFYTHVHVQSHISIYPAIRFYNKVFREPSICRMPIHICAYCTLC